MRIESWVVAGVLLLCSARAALADESQSGFVPCVQTCETGFEACVRHSTGKRGENCPGDFISCRRVCEASAPDDAAAATRSRPLACADACQADYDACRRRDDGKRPSRCEETVMRCRDGCPHTSVTAPPRTDAEERARVPPGAAENRARVPSNLPPEHPTTPTDAGSAPVVPPQLAAARPANAAGAEPPRSVWERAWCLVRPWCRATSAQAPVSCVDACGVDYDACLAREDPKRGASCAAAAMRCKQDCARAPASASP